MIMLVDPTAARASEPKVLPTIIESARVYNSWNRFPMITGIANFRIDKKGITYC